jgi:hypothetical protein
MKSSKWDGVTGKSGNKPLGAAANVTATRMRQV